jgi:ABC-2 type transport system permease protein
LIDQAQRPSGNIYDLGYRPYDGSRLGRAYAFISLFAYSCNAVFGLGRSALNKFFPMGLALVALAPAVFQLGIAALTPADFELVNHEAYFSYVQVVLALFCAATAPELIGRDHRNRTLPLYFSRTLKRIDYVSAKLAAFIATLLAVVLAPQLLLFLGTAVSTDQVLIYVRDNLDLLPPIIASSLIVSLFMASVSLGIACHTTKRALSTGAVIVYFVVLTTVGRNLIETTTGDARQYVVLLSPVDILDGIVYWLFGAEQGPDSFSRIAGQSGEVYFATAAVYSIVCLVIVYRRFLRLVV